MANWTNIPTDRIEPGKPIRAIDGLALRDNPIAIAMGASGAPRIQEAAMNANSINGNRLRVNSVPNDRLMDNSITSAKLNHNSIRSWLGSQGAGAVGTYAMVVPPFSAGDRVVFNWGEVVSGSNLLSANAESSPEATSGNLPGTWRIMSSRVAGRTRTTQGVLHADPGLALRIS